MRSEADIRRQVEARFHRWVFLLVHAGAWAAVAKGLYLYSERVSVPAGWTDSALIVLLLWASLVGLHVLRTMYVESREWLVRRAVDREMREYMLRDAFEKRKRDETPLSLTDDGELDDFLAWNEKAADAQRNRNP